MKSAEANVLNGLFRTEKYHNVIVNIIRNRLITNKYDIMTFIFYKIKISVVLSREIFDVVDEALIVGSKA